MILICDFDRTLIERKGFTGIYKNIIEDLRLDTEKALHSWRKNQGMPIKKQFELLGWDTRLADFAQVELTKKGRTLPIEEVPFARKLIEKVYNKNIPICVSSGSPQLLVEEGLKEIQVFDKIDLVLGTERGMYKGIDHMNKIKDYFQLNNFSDSIYLGDGQTDMIVAKEYLVKYRIGFLYDESDSEEELRQLGANYVYSNLREVSDFLLTLE